MILGMGIGAFLISLVIIIPSFLIEKNEMVGLDQEKKDNAMQH